MQNTEVPVSVEIPRGISFYLIDGIRRTWKIIPFFFVFSFFVSWQVSVLYVFSIVIHELSHLMAAKLQGINTKGIYFTFFGGKLVHESRHPWNRDWVISIAGLASGLLTALVTWTLYVVLGLDLFLAVTVWIAATNLINNIIPTNHNNDAMRVMAAIIYSVYNRDEESLSKAEIGVLAAVSLAIVSITLVLLVVAFLNMGGDMSVLYPMRFSY